MYIAKVDFLNKYYILACFLQFIGVYRFIGVFMMIEQVQWLSVLLEKQRIKACLLYIDFLLYVHEL